MKAIKIESIDHFKKLAEGEEQKDFFIRLSIGRSSKTISYHKSEDEFCINNEIDGSHEDLKTEDLNQTNIPEAIKNGAFFFVEEW